MTLDSIDMQRVLALAEQIRHERERAEEAERLHKAQAKTRKSRRKAQKKSRKKNRKR